VLCSLSPITSLDDFRTLFVQELVAAIGAEKLDLLAPKFLVVAIKFAFALRAGYPENFCQSSDPRIFSRKDAKALSLGIKPIPKKTQSYLRVFAPLREPFVFAYTLGTRSNTARGIKSSSRVFSIAVFGTATRAS
jgi:hypothetical protein